MTIENKEKSNHIRTFLVCRIISTAEKKQKKFWGHLDHGFIYFDKPIDYNDIAGNKIDRYKKGAVYLKDYVAPLSWSKVNGKILMKMNDEMKNNKVYIYKEYSGKYFKTRLKNADA